MKEWRPSGVATIITDPPYNNIALCRELADFAVEVLPDGGALVALCSGPILADVVQAMARPELIWRTPLAWLYGETDNRTYDRPRRVSLYEVGYEPVAPASAPVASS